MRGPDFICCIKCSTKYKKDNGWPLLTCPMCRVKDRERQAQVVYLARLRPLDKWAKLAYRDLTEAQWIATLLHFNAMCAYCLTGSYECLEHFIPLKLGGGTTVSNVVPSCLSCNSIKKGLHPALVTKIPQADIERVRAYLQQF